MKTTENSAIAADWAGWPSLASRNCFQCPHCASIVYSRTSRFCGVCGTNLPANFLFSPAERSGIKTLLQRERDRHRAWLHRRDTRSRSELV